MNKCKYCNTIENLIPHNKEHTSYRNICYDCSNALKKKGKCKYCGTAENLMTRPIMTRPIINQHLKKPKIVTQDVC